MNRILLLLAIGVPCLAGCGRGSDQPELGEVSGTVTLDGQPLQEVIVHFTPTGEGRPSVGQTDENGQYSLLYVADSAGAIVGEHAVTIEAVVTDEMDDYDEENPQAGGAPPLTLPANATDSSIREEVAAGTQEINITLVSDE